MKSSHCLTPATALRPRPVLTAGLLALLSASLAQAAVLPFVPDSTGAAAPLFDPDSGTLLSPATGGNVTVLSGETLSINTTTGGIAKYGTDAFSGTGDTGNTEAADNGSAEVALFTFNNLSIHSGARIEIGGTRAVGLIARNILAVDGRVDLTGMSPGGVGGPGPVIAAGYAGGASVTSLGFSSNGLPGGGITGFGGTAGSTGGGGGRTYTDARLIDLLGGSGGGSGGANATFPFAPMTSGQGGSGGGALLLLAQQSLILGPNAAIVAKGGTGGIGSTISDSSDSAGGGGGGAGGSVVLCSPRVALGAGSQINLAGGNFGNGRSGSSPAAYNGTAGETGRLAIYSKSPVNGGAAITATRFDNPTADYPAALDASAPGGGFLNYLNDNSAVPTPLFDPDNGTLLSPATGGSVTVLAGETLNINTSTGVISKTGTGAFYSLGDTGATATGADGSKEIALFTFQNLTVNSGAVVNITGSRSLGFLVRNSLTIHGTVNLSGSYEPGPGGFTGGATVGTTAPGSPGSGMAGYAGTAGTNVASAGGGPTYWDTRLTDLLGGSGGGSGAAVQGAFAAYSGEGGHGGGGLLLLAQNSITVGPTGMILAKGGDGENGDAVPGLGAAGGGGGGAGGAVVLCAPGIALNFDSQINLAGGARGQGVDMPNGTAGENGRLAIYSKTAPVAFGAVITGTRYDHTLAAYPAALTLAGEPPPVVVSFTMQRAVGSGYIATLVGKGTPGARYGLDRSTDLSAWTQDGSALTAPSDGLMTIVKTANPGTLPRLYYRLRKL